MAAPLRARPPWPAPTGTSRTRRCAWAAGVALVAGSMLAGCDTPPTRAPTVAPTAGRAIPAYKPPTSGATARLTMRGTGLLPGDVYEVSVLQDDERCLDRHSVGVGTATGNPSATTVPAGRPLTIEVYVNSNLIGIANKTSALPRQAVCRTRMTFTPDAGKTYMTLAVGPAMTCRAQLADITELESPRMPAGTLNRMGSGLGCLPLAQSRPMQDALFEASSDGVAVLHPKADAEPLRHLIKP